MYKQEALDVLECYYRNTEHVLGGKDEQVKAIKTCINLVDELEDASSYWEKITINTTDPIREYQVTRCHKCGKYTVRPYAGIVRLYDFCLHCGADMRSKKK